MFDDSIDDDELGRTKLLASLKAFKPQLVSFDFTIVLYTPLAYSIL